MLTQEHAQTALDFLEKADKHYAEGDQSQASAKLWEAAAHAVMAVSAERGWPHASQTELKWAAGRLAVEQSEQSIAGRFAIAEKFRMDFQYLFMEDWEWTADRPKVRDLVA